MSTDTVIAALTNLHRAHSLQDPDSFAGGLRGIWDQDGVDAKQMWLNYLETMKDMLRDKGREPFETYVQNLLGSHPDVTVELLQALYEELGDRNESWGWEQFAAVLDAP